MTKYMRKVAWKNKIKNCIDKYEDIQGIQIPDDVKNSVFEFLARKVDNFVDKNRVPNGFMEVAVSSLLFIRLKGKK